MNLYILKNKTQKIVVAFFCLVNLISYSQNSDTEQLFTNTTSLTSIDLRSKKLVGNSYINDIFLPARISSSKKISFVRYNAYLDEMEVEIKGKAYFLPKDYNYSIFFESNNKTYQLLSFEENGLSKKGFFVVLKKGKKVSLFSKEKIKLYDEVPAKLGFTRYEPPILKRIKDEIYLEFKGNSIVKLPKKKKNLAPLFSVRSKEIALFIKNNKLNFKDVKDLIQIITFYNSME
tara:strand:+ start:124 stop:819 length:696 start_codon:yes stop_codon:yes gene_type:complete